MSREPRSDRPAARQVNIKISDELKRGVYANKLIVSHNREEFVLDFVADLPPGPQIVARTITTPAHAKAFAEALLANVERYEKHHAPIRTRRGGTTPTADA